MITAKFFRKGGLYAGFIISGHGEGEYGLDIACAGVSSAVMLTVNTVTDFFYADAVVKERQDALGLRLNRPWHDGESRALIFSLKEHLELLSEQTGKIKVLVKDC